MVLMTMRNHHPDDLAAIRDQVGKIRNDDINAVHFVFRERKSAVDDQNFILVFQECQVLADFVQSSYRNHL